MDENKDLENLTAEEQTKPVSLPGDDALGSGSPAPSKKLPIVIAVIAVLVVAVVLIAVFATRGRGNKGGAATIAPRFVMTDNLGFGGHNAVLILKKWED